MSVNAGDKESRFGSVLGGATKPAEGAPIGGEAVWTIFSVCTLQDDSNPGRNDDHSKN